MKTTREYRDSVSEDASRGPSLRNLANDANLGAEAIEYLRTHGGLGGKMSEALRTELVVQSTEPKIEVRSDDLETRVANIELWFGKRLNSLEAWRTNIRESVKLVL